MTPKIRLMVQIAAIVLCGFSTMSYINKGVNDWALVFAALTAFNVWGLQRSLTNSGEES